MVQMRWLALSSKFLPIFGGRGEGGNFFMLLMTVRLREATHSGSTQGSKGSGYASDASYVS